MIEISAERDSPSDVTLVVVDVYVDSGEIVSTGTPLFELEGAKSVFEQNAPVSGYFYHHLNIGTEVLVGETLGVISDVELSEHDIYTALNPRKSETTYSNNESLSGPQMSLKAQELWRNLGRPKLSDSLASKSLITVEDLQGLESSIAPDPTESDRSLVDLYRNFRQRGGRKAFLIGGNRGAIQVLDALGHESDIEIVGFLQDYGPAELEHYGWSNLGPITLPSMLRLKDEGVQTALLAIGGPPERVEEVIATCQDVGIALPPIVHSSAVVSATAAVGEGARIMANCSVGPHATVGEGAFVSAFSNIEHHSFFGRASHCGPGLLLSGGVSVGDGARFGVNVAVEPGCLIGARAVLASGTTVTSDVPAGATIKKEVRRSHRE